MVSTGILKYDKRGKKLWDKRESDAKAEAGREIERVTKSRVRRDYDD